MEQDIDEAEPQPLYLAFVDVLSALARETPIGWFCASLVTEGVSSTRHRLASLAMQVAPAEPMLLDAIGDRVLGDNGGDDGSIGRGCRDWMSRVPLVTSRVQREVGEWTAYMAELNWRRWEQLVRSCSAAPDARRR